MATIIPFAALRPNPALADQICELPYDVLSSDEARQLAAHNSLSFLHVSKPEIDLDPKIDLYDSKVYRQGQLNFRRLIEQAALVREAQPHFYLYRQIMGRHSQLGLVALASCDEYSKNIVKKHELTRPDKEDDRVRHIESLDAQTGPAFLIYRADAELAAQFARVVAAKPEVDFTAADGVRHSSWTVREAVTQKLIQTRFAEFSALYIADGHHRTAAAARVARERQGAGASAYFLSVIFPDNQVQILPYNRVLKDLNGLDARGLLKRLQSVFEVQNAGRAQPQQKHEIGLYLNRAWHTLVFQLRLTEAQTPLERLDVSLLQKHVLAPIFSIDDPRTSQRIHFVGGIRGAVELERLVDSGEYACAFSMFPTRVQDLMDVADANGLMPPKSTWFEPKLRDGMFCHLLER
jgi:uncharacterized protein (DUF1015 family)